MKYLLILSFSFFAFFSCETIIFDEDSEKLSKINDAFKDYKAGKYESAKEKFLDVLNTGTSIRRDSIYMGIAFSEMHLNNYELADIAFDRALSININMTDAYYGKMLLSYVFRKHYTNAIRYGKLVIELDKDYVFKYSPTSNIKDVYLHLALSEYQLKNYENSYNYMKHISNIVLDVNSRQFTSQLISHLSDLSNELRGS